MKPEDLADADALVIRSVTRVNEALLSMASRLSFVGTCTIGTDHVDQKLLKERNIDFFSAPGCNKNSVGEYIISAMFVLARRRNFSLKGKTLGIIGAGNTGTSVMNKALALGMKVKLYDPFLERDGNDVREFSSFEETMKSDNVKKGMQQAPHRSLFNALGFTEEENRKLLAGNFKEFLGL